MTPLLKSGEGIRNPRKSDAPIRLSPQTHDSNIHLQFLCTPRSASRSIQRLIKRLPLDATPFALKHEGDPLDVYGGDGRKDVYLSSPQTRRIQLQFLKRLAAREYCGFALQTACGSIKFELAGVTVGTHVYTPHSLLRNSLMRLAFTPRESVMRLKARGGDGDHVPMMSLSNTGPSSDN